LTGRISCMRIRMTMWLFYLFPLLDSLRQRCQTGQTPCSTRTQCRWDPGSSRYFFHLELATD
jgi:hypothetical protein